jgi:hypothetical protein
MLFEQDKLTKNIYWKMKMKNMGKNEKMLSMCFLSIEREGRLPFFFIHVQERIHDFHPSTRGL